MRRDDTANLGRAKLGGVIGAGFFFSKSEGSNAVAILGKGCRITVEGGGTGSVSQIGSGRSEIIAGGLQNCRRIGRIGVATSGNAIDADVNRGNSIHCDNRRKDRGNRTRGVAGESLGCHKGERGNRDAAKTAKRRLLRILCHGSH